MHGITTRLTRLTLIGIACLGSLGLFSAQAAEGSLADSHIEESRAVDGIRLLALTPAVNAMLDISILSPSDGLDRIKAALALIDAKSPASAKAIRRLKVAGPVSVIYYPNNFHDRNRLNTQTVALFLPDFLKKRGMADRQREFSVVVNQFGVKWPTDELAAIIVHELAGHGIQHLEGRIETARLLDLECEASLFQEQAYQDFGVAKKLRTVILFRRQMEYRYCSDFRRYMTDRAPNKLATWDALNPNISDLLEIFGSYRGTQAAQRTRNTGAGTSPISSRSR